ncbi:MAG: hypothetical protein AAF491_06075 [Verrucomicrobiota bacterium]
MKIFSSAVALALGLCSLSLVSCQTVDSGPEPQREKLSSIPHNMPESWEGTAGMPGAFGMQQQY